MLAPAVTAQALLCGDVIEYVRGHDDHVRQSR